ncbi:FAD/NAD(P)-binding domain-containing protein [Fomitopsis serialis]|uniref:FAD/NAD(P)-binding domain-containing protein n=1 Tax=Fomitopsis serialis TaxID=139415 RepID=UPI0020071F0E|nr:FAD/NAD(P)-binding domain-containing protein [Neoantrodia serialis]KAH9926235.1 FAD/NAD(P)-binding domain-containing protein [Neoantrodia serialis]
MMSSAQPSARKAVVVGAGPVGCLAAISLAKMGWTVEIYEGRPDMRLPSSKAAAQQRSINLAMSSRGIAAIEAIHPSAAARFLKAVIPMRGRMIHHVGLALPNISAFFKHKVISLDFDKGIMVVSNNTDNENREVPFDFCVGADGAYSIVRRQLMRVVRWPPMSSGGDPSFLLDANHLHIWPRHTFMLIALPNKDKTFTCTLFAPTAEFDRLNTPETIIQFFKAHFPDALPLIGEQALLEDFKRNPRSSLMSIKAQPYHYKDRVVIIGDAAHAMVPFYGQGLNCGLEDVRVLDIILRTAQVNPAVQETKEDNRLLEALARYSDSRHADLVSICELAMDNYVEMRHSVVTPAYLIRHALDNILYSLTVRAATLSALIPSLSREPFPSKSPAGWLPLYTMVTFRPDISYSTARHRYAGWATAVTGLSVAGLVAVSVWRRLYNRG